LVRIDNFTSLTLVQQLRTTKTNGIGDGNQIFNNICRLKYNLDSLILQVITLSTMTD